MHHFAMRSGVMHAEDVELQTLATEIGTPFYCYSTATLKRHFEIFDSAFCNLPRLICYAVKANSNQAVLKSLAMWSREANSGARSPRVSHRKKLDRSAIYMNTLPIFASGRARLISMSRPAVDRGVSVRAPASNINYIAGCDGGRSRPEVHAFTRPLVWHGRKFLVA
jgi:hypothetical protein